MPEKKGEMATNGKSNPKKANLLDQNSIKHILDESVTEIVTSKGYVEDVRLSNIRLLIGAIIIIIALFAQFYNKKFPDNRNFLIGCIVLYILFNGILQLIIYTKEKNAILFTYPPPQDEYLNNFIGENDHIFKGHRFAMSSTYLQMGSFNTTGLVVSSKLPRFSDMYTLTVASADPQSISAKPPVKFTKSVTQWFTKEGVMVEGLFWKDVEGLINDYAKETKKSK